jgi:hypothetical protein
MWIPRLAKIFPGWVHRFDEADFPGPRPSLQFLFALNGETHFGEAFEPDESSAVVTSSETTVLLQFVLEDTTPEVTRHTNVEGSALAGENVGEVVMLTHWRESTSSLTK